ncbi:MAG: alcohol dehydrogenase family protein [Parvibaculaceae bacterium]
MSIPEKMRAAVLVGHGGREMLEVRDDVPVPSPGKNEVLVKVGAAAMNNTDIWTREGHYPSAVDARPSGWRGVPLSFPRIQGLDVVGRVVALGPAATAPEIGQRVVIDPSVYDPQTETVLDVRLIGSELDGGFAEYIAVPSENAVPVSSAFSDAELASFPGSYRTAEHMLNRADVKPGERVLVTGASGGVGTALIQLSRARGARPFAIIGLGKEKRASELGAERVYTRSSDGSIDLAEICREKFDVLADVVGGPIFSGLLGALRKGGRCVIAGAIGGSEILLDLRQIYLNHLALIGSSTATHEELRAVVRYIEMGKLRPLVDREYDLKDIHVAQDAFMAKRHFGKIVLRP